MAQEPITFERFGGLRLDLPLNEVGGEQATALLDVDPGPVLKQRPGVTQWSKTEHGKPYYDRIYPHSIDTLLARRQTVVAAISSETQEEFTTVEVLGKLGFAHMGTPSASYTYIGSQSSGIKRFDGKEFTAPLATVDGVAEKAMPKTDGLVTWPEGGNRLCALGTPSGGGPGDAASSSSHVWFSEPGNAEEWNTEGSEAHPANYVQLSPGDGEGILGGCYWNGQVFVFKETKCFIFYAVGVDEEGHPEFLFRAIELGTRLRQPVNLSPPPFCSGTGGVYFVSNDGVWVTTGGVPTLLSGSLAPLALPTEERLPEPAYGLFGKRRWSNTRSIRQFGRYLFVGLNVPGATATSRLVRLDLATNEWVVWNVLIHDLIPWAIDEVDFLFFSSTTAGGEFIYYFDPTSASDPLVTMEPLWQSGFYDLGDPDEKQLNMTRLFGKGKVSVKAAKDFGEAGTATTKELTKASTPNELAEQDVAQARFNKDQEGVLFSHRFEGEEGKPFEVHCLTRYLRSSRVPGTKDK